ncbi:hypothetical protein AN958_12358, partial [Leucoagaricus sp. SymC.cos]
DDTAVFLLSKDCFTTLTKISGKWCQSAGAKFNKNKTEILFFGSKEYKNSIRINQVITPVYYVKFTTNGLHLEKPPPHSSFTAAKLADMSDPVFAHLENIPVIMTKGPLKGCSGVIKSITMTGIASIKMVALFTQVNQLQQVNIQNLVFELEANEFYQANEGSLLEYTA